MATFGGAGASALSDLITLAFPITGTDGTVPNQKNNDQPTIEALLKERVKESQGWNSASSSLFAGLPAGIPFSLGMATKIVQQFTGLPVDDLLGPWLANPVLGNLSDSMGSVFGVMGQFQSAFMQFLGDINFLDPDFDPAAAVADFITIMLLPSGLLPSLVGGFLPTSIIPGLDASKIISGVFGTGVIPGLDVSKITSGLLSGGTIITSLIPGLDASKIITGTFGTGLIPGLDVSKIVSGTFGAGFIPTLDASKIGSGIFGTSLIPGLDVSKIISGTFGAGFIPGLDTSKIISGTFSQSMVTNLVSDLTTNATKIQDLIDVGIQGILGGSGTGYFLSDWRDALREIPGSNVLGAGGMPTMNDTITTMWDNVTSALRRFGLTGVTLSDFAAAAQNTSSSADDGYSLAVSQTNILGTRTNKPIIGALERTSISNLSLNALGTGSTPTNFAVTQAASAIGIIRMPESDTKGLVYWRSSGNANVTGFYLNFSKLAVDGTITPLFSSGNLASQLTSGWQWQSYTMASANKISHNASENILVEFQVVGSGTVTIAGVPMAWMTDDHPVATTKRSGGTRNTGASGPTSLTAFNFTGNTPYVAMGRSDVPAGYVPPELSTYTTSGTYTRPTWMVNGDILDIFVLPAGGGGQSGGYGVSGEGGTAGTWAVQSYVMGSDIRGTGLPVIPLSTTVFSHTLGAPGSGGVNPYTLDPGDNAASSSVSATGMTTLTGAGGLGGGRAGNNTSSTSGQAAGNRTLGGYTAFGGTAAGVNQDGVDPGGGGGSGYPAFGRLGGHAKVWYRARQGG